MVFTSGLIAGYAYFSPSGSTTSVIVTPHEMNSDNSNTSQNSEKADSSRAQIDELNQIITAQSERILTLQAELSSLATEVPVVTAPPTEVSKTMVKKEEEIEPLVTITTDDFNRKIKDQFLSRFKGYAIQMEGEQLAELQKNFDRQQEKNSWSAEYENHISDYLSRQDPNGIHFIEELNCNKNMCRLKVQSTEGQQWKKLYASMTKQDWYSSMTLVEKNENPNKHIYYIRKHYDY